MLVDVLLYSVRVAFYSYSCFHLRPFYLSFSLSLSLFLSAVVGYSNAQSHQREKAFSGLHSDANLEQRLKMYEYTNTNREDKGR